MGAKILIVEDEEYVRESIVQILELKGHDNILQTAAGAEAIVIIAKENPDIVFLDIQLADDTTGMDVLRQCRQIAPKVAVVMMSAYAEQYEKPAKELGAFGFLKKPITSFEPLLRLITEITADRL